MLTVEEALEQILSRITPLGTELVELTAALGRVLAEPTVSRRELPPWPNSSMDGYAVRADDTRAGGVELVVVGRIIAGSLPAGTLRPGAAMRIVTGAPLAEGAGPRGGRRAREPRCRAGPARGDRRAGPLGRVGRRARVVGGRVGGRARPRA